MYLMMAGIGWLCESVARMAEAVVFALHAVWVTIVRAAIALIGVVDEWFADIDFLDNPLLRMAVMGAVGFEVATVLIIFLSLAAGYWCVPCCFIFSGGFCAFVGLVADPDQDWSVGSLPGSSRSGGPKTPLNL